MNNLATSKRETGQRSVHQGLRESILSLRFSARKDKLEELSIISSIPPKKTCDLGEGNRTMQIHQGLREVLLNLDFQQEKIN